MTITKKTLQLARGIGEYRKEWKEKMVKTRNFLMCCIVIGIVVIQM